jgi:hypothetical protein
MGFREWFLSTHLGARIRAAWHASAHALIRHLSLGAGACDRGKRMRRRLGCGGAARRACWLGWCRRVDICWPLGWAVVVVRRVYLKRRRLRRAGAGGGEVRVWRRLDC